MTVTEFALLHLNTPSSSTTTTAPADTNTNTNTPTPLPTPLLKTLSHAMQIQDTWHATAFPSLPSSSLARAAHWFRQIEDPSWILTTALWSSVEAHWDWIRSPENAGVMGGLTEAGAGDSTTGEEDGEEGKGKEGWVIAEDTGLWHVGGVLFAGEKGEGEEVGLLESPVISLGRMYVKKGEDRERFAAKFEEVRGILERFARPHAVRFGWREDGEEGAEEEEFVLVAGWESVAQHFAFAESAEFPKYGEIRDLIARVELKHYQRFSLE
ncbi:uncharacterized protein C8A04DRAFT_25001 [Dichotomopilus funicola]|uniref:ABM domain-containing protein n=1 Tax=Dichotomopilus funicola TaxID=1934379 RepID=A0AAN6V9Z7_9PEZI|nr:hypothetical protein C8A04DRAFT_25001 [Dichotomopilus funicola]